eukprot:4209214-Alexandrium_andersonii.AAC.1
MLMTILELLGRVDQVNLGGLCGVEILRRRAQLIESTFELSRDGKTPDFFHSEEMVGLSSRQSGVVIAAGLEKATAERLAARRDREG